MKRLNISHEYDCDDDGDGPRCVQNAIFVDGKVFASHDSDDDFCEFSSYDWAQIAEALVTSYGEAETLREQARNAVDADTAIKAMLGKMYVGDAGPGTAASHYNDGVRFCIEVLESLKAERAEAGR